MLKTSLACSHGRILRPILVHVPEDVSGAVELVRRVLVVLVHLGKVWPREGKEGHKSVEIDPLESLCLHGVKPVLMRGELLMETVDSVVQSKEDRELRLRCLGVDLRSSCGRSCLCLPGSLGSQSFLCLPGSLGSLPLLPESAGQVEEGRDDNEAQGDDVDDQVPVHPGGDSEVGVGLRVL